jgi:hypothetical protein
LPSDPVFRGEPLNSDRHNWRRERFLALWNNPRKS